MKSTAFTRVLAMLLVVTLLAAGVTAPVSAEAESRKITYTAADKTKRTVLWTPGVTPPELPKDFQGDSPFGTDFTEGAGWYDLNLPEEDSRSEIAAAANAMHWWLDRNRTATDTYLSKHPSQGEYADRLADPGKVRDLMGPLKTQNTADSAIFSYFAKQAGEGSYAPDGYLDLMLNGYALNKKQNTPERFEPSGKNGGFFFPALDMIPLTNRDKVVGEPVRDGDKIIAEAPDFVEMLESYFDMECAIILSLREGKSKVHYVNLWGGEFSEDHALTALYLTNPRDGADGKTPDLIRCPVKSEKNQFILTLPGDRDLTMETVFTLFSGTDFLETFEPSAPPQNDIPGEPDGPAPEQQTWNDPQYVWADDLSACTATRSRTEDSKHVESAEASVTKEETKKPTDTQPGTMTYVATFSADWADPQTRTADIPAENTQWGEPEYKWSEDYKSCEAIRRSLTDPNVEEKLQARVTSEQTKAPTQSEKGQTTYTATFTEKWAQTQTHVESDIPMLSTADWKPTEYKWSSDGKTCTAIRVRTDGSDRQELSGTIVGKKTKAPTCAAMGETTYTASFGADWAQTQTKTVTDLDMIPHVWGETKYEWYEDGRKCRAYRVCENDETHVEEAWATVTSKQTTAPTVSAMGRTTYTAVFTEKWAQTQSLTMDDIPKLEDEWEKPTYTWSEDNKSCTAKRVNKNDKSITQTATANVTFVRTKKPTATEKGETTYTASFKEGWAKDQKKTVADVPKLTEEADDDSLWREPTYEWSRDHSRCTASRAKKNDPSSVVMAYGTVTVQEVKAATCTEPGESIYTATFREKWAKDQKETVKVTDGRHSLEPVAEVPATGSADGVKAHYRCKLCGKLFSDPEGTKEVTAQDLTIPKPTLSGSNAIVNAIPEKEFTVAVTPDMLSQALKDNRSAKGVLITVGDASVVYARDTVEKLLKDAKDSRKLVLYAGPTDFTDGGMTTDQALAAQHNGYGTYYHVKLMDGRKELKAPCTVMIPYEPTVEGQTRAYRLEEDGSFHVTTSQYAKGYLAWNADTGFFLLSEQEPVAEKSSGRTGMIVWIVVLVISGLLFLGGGGFLLWRKFGGLREDDFSTEPQLDAAARDRIRGKTPAVPGRAKPAAPKATTAETAASAAPRVPVTAAAPAAPRVSVTAAAPAEPQYVPQAPQTPAAVPAAPVEEYQGAFETHAPEAGGYQGAFEAKKPTIADKTVKAAHKSAKPRANAAAQDAKELDELEKWLSELE